MPKLDKQKRLLIPLYFREEVNLSHDLALCYDFEEKAILICNKEDIFNKYVITFRTLDAKGRIIIPLEVLTLLDATTDDKLILYLRNNNVFIRKF